MARLSNRRELLVGASFGKPRTGDEKGPLWPLFCCLA